MYETSFNFVTRDAHEIPEFLNSDRTDDEKCMNSLKWIIMVWFVCDMLIVLQFNIIESRDLAFL